MDQQNVGSKRPAASATGRIATKSHEAAEQLKDAVVEQVNQTRDRALSARGDTSERIRGVAAHLRELSDTLREREPLVANLAQRAGQGVDGLARYVNDASPQSVIRDTEQLARRQPALFYGSAFLLGLAAARFLKSARPEGYERSEFERRDDGSGSQQRLERQSGFFPADRNARGNQQSEGDNDATFGRDEPTWPADRANGITPATPAPAANNPPSESRDNDALAGRTRKGNVS
jgi:hypothetical protein